jgi:hypothetical protein
MLVYFEPAALCDLQKDLAIAPLPAKKQLWEASSEFLWRTEKEVESIPITFGLAVNGELVQFEKTCSGDAVLLHKSLGYKSSSRSKTNWEEWCSGMDGLGGLVMLAASFVS